MSLLTIWVHVFQSIEREEPIEVDPTLTHAGLENGHAAATGNHVTTATCVKVLKGGSTDFTYEDQVASHEPVKTAV